MVSFHHFSPLHLAIFRYAAFRRELQLTSEESLERSLWWRSLIFAILVLTSCATPQVKPVSESVADITRRIPKRIPDREGWARDVHAAIKALDLEPTAERVCAVLAVIEQE